MPERLKGGSWYKAINRKEVEDGISEFQEGKEVVERKLAEQVQFRELYWINSRNEKTTDGSYQAYFEPTEVGKKIEELLKEYDLQQDEQNQDETYNRHAYIIGKAVFNARELAEKYGRLPKDKIVSSHFASDVYELGVDLYIRTTVNLGEGIEEHERLVAEKITDLSDLTEKIRALGVDCRYQEVEGY